MKVALDPYMLRSVPLTALPGIVADLGYEHIELSPREDFMRSLPIHGGVPTKSRRSNARSITQA